MPIDDARCVNAPTADCEHRIEGIDALVLPVFSAGHMLSLCIAQFLQDARMILIEGVITRVISGLLPD